MKNKIRNRFPLLFFILKLIKNKRNTAYINEYINYDKDYSIVKLNRNPEGINNDITCKIVAGGKNDGFFACIRWALDGLYFCDYYGLNPIILFPDDSLYLDIDRNDNVNPFEYYFDQPYKNTIQTIHNSKTVIELNGKNKLLSESLNGGINYNVSKLYIEEMALIVKKYLKFNSSTKNIIKNEINNRKIKERTLGVHIRGTDYKKNYKNHPSYVSLEQYMEEIDKAMSTGLFDRIFIATDDKEILDKMIKKYSRDLVLFGENVTRGNSTTGVHTMKSNRKHNGYYLGLEVIIDMCSLVECDGLISSMSQVGLFSRIFKKSKNLEYKYDVLLSNGVNKKGKMFKV